MMLYDEFNGCESDIMLDGKVALVTGATSGTGFEIAKNLAQRGAKIVIASRNILKLEEAKQKIIKHAGHDKVVARQVDFESLKSVRNFVEMVKLEQRLDILINNVGAIGLEDKLTNDNLHLMMQVNYFAAFLLTFLLFPLLKASAPSRIVNVSSLALLFGHIDLDHINDVGVYSNFGYYSNAKLALVLFTVEMNERINNSGVSVFSVDPGLGKSMFFNNLKNEKLKVVLNAALLKFGRPLHRVATVPVYLAISETVKNDSGKHFRDCKEFYSTWFVNDTVLRRNLWDKSKNLVGITKKEDWEY